MDLSNPMRSVIPTVEADVLQVLAGTEGSLTGREIHRLIGTRSYDGVRRALERLTREGLVDRVHAGRSHMFSLNHDHLAANAIKQIAHLRFELIDRIRSHVDGWPVQPDVVALFGSTARSDSDRVSDIDLFVVRPDTIGADSADWVEATYSLEQSIRRWTGNDVRSLEMSPAEIERPGHEAVLRDIARDGVELVGSLSSLRRKMRSNG